MLFYMQLSFWLLLTLLFVFQRKLYSISDLTIKSPDHLRFIMHAAVCKKNNGNYALNESICMYTI